MNAPSEPSLLVACLCAEWCDVCRDYRSVFEQVKDRFPQARFLWVDIEDQADLVDPVEVDDFPTLLVAVGPSIRFLGPMIPRADRLERLLREHLTPAPVGDAAQASASAQSQALLQRLLQASV